jgi:uncharacterized protein (DUF1684 family)
MEASWLDLYDWRRRVADMYRERESAFRAGDDEVEILRRFRESKDLLFRQHPQSPIDASRRDNFVGLSYFPYDEAMCLEAVLEPETDANDVEMGTSGPDLMPMRRAGRLRFSVAGRSLELVVFWIDVYGGGLFAPFRDATCPVESYGGGRYLFDTVKGSDFIRLDGAAQATAYGYTGGRVLLDFNYAYNPSCAYDPRWVCPLASRENWLAVPIRAGERKYEL